MSLKKLTTPSMATTKGRTVPIDDDLAIIQCSPFLAGPLFCVLVQLQTLLVFFFSLHKKTKEKGCHEHNTEAMRHAATLGLILPHRAVWRKADFRTLQCGSGFLFFFLCNK
jgi:hypothetical protein